MKECAITHPIDIAGLHRDLPLFEVAPGTRIAVLNVLGDTELVETAARVGRQACRDRLRRTCHR